MKVERSQVTKLTITGAHRLDPITVFAEDIGPRQGKITIECWGKSWSAYWGGMGDSSIAEFFRSCSTDYIANKLSDIDANLTDETAIEEGARRQIVQLRRGELLRSGHRIGRADITRDEARELWEEVDRASFGADGWAEAKLLQNIFGDEWWYRLPTRPNPEYGYLCRIIEAVQAGFALANQSTAPSSGEKRSEEQ